MVDVKVKVRRLRWVGAIVLFGQGRVLLCYSVKVGLGLGLGLGLE